MQRKKNVLTTVGDLHIDDVFARPDRPQHWRIISTTEHHKGKKKQPFHVMAVVVNADQLLPRSFTKHEQVIYLHKAICV